MKRIVGIVQARMGSTRLPGKSMIRLKGRPVVEHVLRRVLRAESLTQIVLAIPDQAEDEVLCNVAESLCIKCFRGPERDVLKRFVLAAENNQADVVVRICADNPLVAPEEIDRIVRHHLRTGADYSFNHRPGLDNQYPDGLGAEVINFEVLKDLDRHGRQARHREHVTSYIWDNLPDFHVETLLAPPGVAGPSIKLDLDTKVDLSRLELLFSKAPSNIEDWKAMEIVQSYKLI